MSNTLKHFKHRFSTHFVINVMSHHATSCQRTQNFLELFGKAICQWSSLSPQGGDVPSGRCPPGKIHLHCSRFGIKPVKTYKYANRNFHSSHVSIAKKNKKA